MMSLARTLVTLTWPWLTLFYVWWIGFHWTLIGLGCIYGLSVIVATAIVIDRERRAGNSQSVPRP